MPVMSLSNLSPGCFPTRLSFALTGIASAVGTQGGKGLGLKGAKAGTAKLQLAATIKTLEPVFISFLYFSFACRLVGIGSRALGMAGNWSPASSNGRALESLPAGTAESSKLGQALRNLHVQSAQAERRKDWAT